MRKLQYPAIYKHFKGMYYAAMGISEPIENIEGMTEALEIKHTELGTIFMIYKKDNKFYHDVKESTDTLAIYRSLYDAGSYGRPLEMFLSKVDKEKYRFANQEYRLELVEILNNDEKVEDRANQIIEKFNNYMANMKDMKDEEKLSNVMALLMEQQTLINAILLNRR